MGASRNPFRLKDVVSTVVDIIGTDYVTLVIRSVTVSPPNELVSDRRIKAFNVFEAEDSVLAVVIELGSGVNTSGAVGVVRVIGNGDLGFGSVPYAGECKDVILASELSINLERSTGLNKNLGAFNLPAEEVHPLVLRSGLGQPLSSVRVCRFVKHCDSVCIVLILDLELLSIQPRPIDGSVTVDGSVLVERITVPIDPAGELIVRNIRCFRELLGSESACVDVDRGVVLDCSWGIQIVCQANLLGSPFRVNLQVGIGHGFRFEVKRGRTRFILVPTLESVVIRQTGWTIRIGVGLILG